MAGEPSQPLFLPGLELARAFFAEAVEPLVARRFPDLRYAAGLLGHGSDVLGFDDSTSTDHEWGPRAVLFLAGSDADRTGEVAAALRQELPVAFRGFSTHFAPPDARIRRMELRTAGPVDHKVEVTTVRAFCADRLGFDPLAGVTVEDWLATPSQSFVEVTGGAVFRDDCGELARVRAALAWYPRDVWLVRMAAQWHRVAQLEAFVGRAGEIGDDLGSRLVTASIVRDLMLLAFLHARRYAPYAKWLGTAFARLPAARTLGPPLATAVAATGWRERERALGRAYELLALEHNALAVTPPLDPSLRSFHGRPYRVLEADRFFDALRSAIGDERLRAAADAGAVDQYVDGVDVVEWPPLTRAFTRALLADG